MMKVKDSFMKTLNITHACKQHLVTMLRLSDGFGVVVVALFKSGSLLQTEFRASCIALGKSIRVPRVLNNAHLTLRVAADL